jgi:hypothetical protein
VSTYGLSMPARFDCVRFLLPQAARAGCAFIKRPHLSAVSFLKSGCFVSSRHRFLRCIVLRAAKKRNYGALQKSCQASPPGQLLERRLESPESLAHQRLAARFARPPAQSSRPPECTFPSGWPDAGSEISFQADAEFRSRRARLNFLLASGA